MDGQPLPTTAAYSVGDVDISFGFDENDDAIPESAAVFEATGDSDPDSDFLGCEDLSTGEALPELIYRVDDLGVLYGYRSVSDFAVNANPIRIAACTPPDGFLSDSGPIFFDGKFYAVSSAGKVLEYSSDRDLACGTHGTVIATVADYSTDVGYLALPEPSPSSGLGAGIIVAAFVLARRSRRSSIMKGSSMSMAHGEGDPEASPKGPFWESNSRAQP